MHFKFLESTFRVCISYDISFKGRLKTPALQNNFQPFILSLFPYVNNSKKNLLISRCGNFVERYSFRIVSKLYSSETMRKLCLSTKFTHEEIGWNYSILRSVWIRFWMMMMIIQGKHRHFSMNFPSFLIFQLSLWHKIK